MPTTVGQIGLDLVLNNISFNKQLTGIQMQAKTVSDKVSAQFKKIGATVAAVFSAKAIAAFGKDCIKLGSDLTEVQNVVDVVFGKMSGNINDWAKKAAASYGLSETIAKKYAGLYGAMADASGLAEQQVYDMSTALTGLAGDVASFYNITQDEAYTKLKAVFSGETEVLKDLGIVMTEDALNSYALANGIDKTVNKMTQAEKVTLRYNFITNQLSNAQGDFARTSNAWANQVRVLSLRFDSLKATIGQGLINAFTPVIKMINSLVERLTTVSNKFKALTEQIFGNAGSTSASISDTAASVSSLTDNANESSTALDGIADSTEKAKRSVAGFDKLNILTKNENKTSANNTTTAASTPTTNGNNLSSSMSSAIDKFASSWNNKGQKIINSIKKAFDSIKNAVLSIGQSWKNVWNNGSGEKLLNNIKNHLSHCIDNIGYIAEAFKKAWNKGGLGNSVIQSIIDRANSLIELIDTIAEDFGKVWNNGVGERIWTNILTIIKNCNDATKTLRDKIKLAWDKNDTGKKIWENILGIVEDVTDFLKDMSEIRLDWLESLDLSPLMSGVEKLTGAFRGLLKVCGDKLKLAYKTVLLPLAKWTIEKAVPKLVEALSNALKFVADVVKKINAQTLHAIAGGIAAVGTAIVVFKTGAAIAAGIDKVKKAIGLLLSTISAHPILAIASAIGGLAVAVQTYNALEWSNSEAAKFSDEISKIKSEIETNTQVIADNLSSTLETLDGIYADNTLIDDYQKKLEELLAKAELTPEEQSQLQTIVTYFENNVDGFKETWNKYVEKSNDGSYELKEDLKLVQDEINNTINEYQKLASMSALSELSTENSKEQIEANKKLADAKEKVANAQKKVDLEETVLNNWLKKNNLTRGALENAADNDARYSTGKKYLENVKSYTNELNSLKSTYNDQVAEMNKLIMTGDDLSDVQKVLNGDYSDAAAVMMAYKAGMINLEDVQESQWKSLNSLEKAAKDTGKNTVIGLVDGTNEYKGALVTNSNGLASLVLSEYDRVMKIHSPSEEMHDRGVFTLQGLIDGFLEKIQEPVNIIKRLVDKILYPIQQIAGKIKEKIDPIKNVFKNAFSGIWSVIKQPINWLMEHLENFINGFIGGVNEMISGVDWAVNSVGNLFGQEWHVGKLEKVTLPRFAKGGIVKAPTLALVGDNTGANTGDPEIVSPLSRLQGMIDNSGNAYDTEILKSILNYLKKMYEMFLIFQNNGGNMYEFVAKLNGSVFFDEMIKQNQLYKKRHNGKSAFA